MIAEKNKKKYNFRRFITFGRIVCMETNKTTSKILNRNISYDLLRIISALSVVMLHVSGLYIQKYPVGSMDFRIANFYDSISRFGIPIFVMISGAIFLSEEKTVTTKKLWTKNILRLFIVYLVWAFAYYAYQCIYYWNVSIFHKGILGVVTGIVYASDHFWFIFMIIGIYALVPFLRTWLSRAEKKELNYFVVLFVVFQVVRVTISILVDKSLVTQIADMVKITELSRYLGYFVLGHILAKYDVSKKLKIAIYALVPVGVVVNFIVSDVMSLRYGTYNAGIYDTFGFFTFVITVAIFIFFKGIGTKLNAGPTFTRVLGGISLDTLGIYLLHVGVLDFLGKNGILFGSLSPIVGVPVIGILTFLLCGLISALLRRIPVVGRYLA